MQPWKDEHFVQLQKQDSERPNRVLIGSEEVGRPKGYLAYSAMGTVQGKAVYGNYGRQQDLDVLQKNNVELKGCVMLLRAGNLSFAQQVFNAARLGASAVLIYPDPQDYPYTDTTELYGHVHLGSGDPYTPGFPSFNHTQFPPTQSSGLPSIPAQTITALTAARLLEKMGGPVADGGFQGNLSSVTYRLGGVASDDNVTVEVHNTLVHTQIHNVFGVIKGFSDPDRYVVLGAQRDAWGPGYAKATMGTAILMELARALHDMVENDGFRPLRSIVFASWSAGEYGSVGATEWLEAYVSSLDRKAFTYISLDGAVAGRGAFTASASPLLNDLLASSMKEVNCPLGAGSLYDSVGGPQWAKKVLRPMQMEDPAYPFLAFSGIPSISFHFVSTNAAEYPFYGTPLDTADHLGYATSQRPGEMAVAAGRLAGVMALQLVHAHMLPLRLQGYASSVFQAVVKVNRHVDQLSRAGALRGVTTQWLSSALGSFRSAARAFNSDVANTDLSNPQACRALNDRIMAVEHHLLSPYVSLTDVPFRHLLLGHGAHTLAAIAELTDGQQLHTQLALATWTLQGCVNAMATHLWDVDNQI
ncbi:transferrin receptor 1b [Aplochiton taeniatus]